MRNPHRPRGTGGYKWLATMSLIAGGFAGSAPEVRAQPIAIDVPHGTPWVRGAGWNTKDTMLRRNLRREVKYTLEDIVELWLMYDHYRDLFGRLWPFASEAVDDMMSGSVFELDHIALPLEYASWSVAGGELIGFNTGILYGAADADAEFARVYAPDPSFDGLEHADQAAMVAEQALVTAQATLLSAARHAENLDYRNERYLENLMQQVRTALPRTKGLEEIQADLDAYISQEYLLLENALLLLGNLKAVEGASGTFWDAQAAVRQSVEAPASTIAPGLVPLPPPPGLPYTSSPGGGRAAGEE